ncbi:hypothetical protein GCM10010145_32160 [Streptomyces ruber]|uniref:Uncharacterized protein n=2 Tax=Streptomyces TaxID=1883 RepID=A0A918BDF9_9ACTN|nr:hypothetical protein GCM10010145_32160 [Streptomyces ruber]
MAVLALPIREPRRTLTGTEGPGPSARHVRDVRSWRGCRFGESESADSGSERHVDPIVFGNFPW